MVIFVLFISLGVVFLSLRLLLRLQQLGHLTRHITLAIRQPLATESAFFLSPTPEPLEYEDSENTRIETHQLA